MRTGISYMGHKAVAICLDDVLPHLSADASTIKKAVKTGAVGGHNVAKDFVPPKSEDPSIRRGTNSHSRKCTIVWLEKLPTNLQQSLLQGIINTSLFLVAYDQQYVW